MALTVAQRQKLYDAIIEFVLPVELDAILFIRLGRPPYLVAAQDHFPSFVTGALLNAKANEWEEELVVVLAEAKPRNRVLRLLADEIVATPYFGPLLQLERRLQKHNSLLKALPWRFEMEVREAQVCNVLVQTPEGRVSGTGFLIAPNLVLTNHHVIAPLLDPDAAGIEDTICRFDFKTLKDGRTITAGVEYHLDAIDWHVASSPLSAHDDEREPKSGLPTDDELDFAIVRLDERAGDHSVGAKQAIPGAATRGFIRIPAAPAAIVDGQPLVALQHPEGRPLEIAWGTSRRLNGNGTRLEHLIDTEGGSSGSPIFDLEWNLVALHHAGDPNFDKRHKPSYNQAIPISKIKEAATRSGVVLPK